MGLRLDWLGTEALSWRDLLVITQQSPATSALTRARYPEERDRDAVSAKLEQVVVMLARLQMLTAVNDVPPSDLPSMYSDVFESVSFDDALSDEEIDAMMTESMNEIDRRMGWA